MRMISQNPKNGGEPCPNNLMEVSNCEKEGFADNSVPDCDNKVMSKLIGRFLQIFGLRLDRRASLKINLICQKSSKYSRFRLKLVENEEQIMFWVIRS